MILNWQRRIKRPRIGGSSHVGCAISLAQMSVAGWRLVGIVRMKKIECEGSKLKVRKQNSCCRECQNSAIVAPGTDWKDAEGYNSLDLTGEGGD